MNRLIVLITLIFLLVLTSCDIPTLLGSSAATQQEGIRYQTLSAMLTQTEASGSTLMQTATLLVPPTVDMTTPSLPATPLQTPSLRVPTPTVSFTAAVVSTSTSAAPSVACDLAQAGRPIDVTIPDDTRVKPGEYFTKVWRLVNAGSCTWDNRYALVWFSGTDMGLSHTQPLNRSVSPGQSIDIAVEMVAPKASGSYQSNWKLRNPQGQVFGIGPAGNAPFWVRVIVVPDQTPTPVPSTPTVEPSPTATLTPQVYLSGNATLADLVGLDLESGEVGQGAQMDVELRWPENGQVSLAFLNGVLAQSMGQTMPQQSDCQAAALSTDLIQAEGLQPGMAICLRTSQALPGRLVVAAFDADQRQLQLEFTIWVVP